MNLFKINKMLKDKEMIKRLKAIEALEQKSCEGCRYENNAGFEEECHYCNRWEEI